MRDYDPALGRYLQADPLGLVDGASMYGYALQNPGRWTDPTGLSTSNSGSPPNSFTEDDPLQCVKSSDQCYEEYEAGKDLCNMMHQGNSTVKKRARQRCWEQLAQILADCVRNARSNRSLPSVPLMLGPFAPGNRRPGGGGKPYIQNHGLLLSNL